MSVILAIPTHIRHDLCRECIDSALAGSVPPDAVLVVDNFGYFEHPDPRVKRLTPTENLGVARSWNWLHRESGGVPTVYSNDDIVFGEHAIRDALAADAPFVALCGWACFLQKDEVWKAVGDYDERFWPAYFEDNDYAYRMKLAGVPAVDLPAGSVAHHGSSTLAKLEDVHRQTVIRCFEQNKAYYHKKWGGLPGDEKFTSPFGGGS